MKILYVEDEEIYTKPMQRLTQFMGHQLVVAANGSEGFALAHEQPDLIFVDLNLPDIDGLTLVQKLRAVHILIPIIAVTSDEINYDRAKALAAGCDEYFEKPVSLETVRNLLLRYSSQKPPQE